MTDTPKQQADNWERFRDFLLVLARTQTDVRWRGKLDVSGLVQQTLLEAYQAGEQIAAGNDAQKAGWLKKALANNLADEVRKITAIRRDAGRERSLEVAMDESVSHMERLLPAGLATPSHEAVRAERVLRVTRALAALPDGQREVIELHHLRGQTLIEVAEALNLTRPAVAGLLHRGLKKLREMLAEDETNE